MVLFFFLKKKIKKNPPKNLLTWSELGFALGSLKSRQIQDCIADGALLRNENRRRWTTEGLLRNSTTSGTGPGTQRESEPGRSYTKLPSWGRELSAVVIITAWTSLRRGIAPSRDWESHGELASSTVWQRSDWRRESTEPSEGLIAANASLMGH